MEKKNNYILRLAGMILGATLTISLLILLIGYIYFWNEPVEFRNAFFITGAIIIVLGVLSVTGGFAQRANFSMMNAESDGQANQAERRQRTLADVTQRYWAMIFLITTGFLLIGISVSIGNFLIE